MLAYVQFNIVVFLILSPKFLSNLNVSCLPLIYIKDIFVSYTHICFVYININRSHCNFQ